MQNNNMQEKIGLNQGSQEFRVTNEGSEAGFIELVKKAESMPDFQFFRSLKSLYPDSKVYLIGGTIRDTAMDLPADDFDFVISGVSKQKLEEFLDINGNIVATTDRQTASYKFIPENFEKVIDLAVPRKETYVSEKGRTPDVETENITIEEDLARRDLTINAIAIEVFGDHKIIDNFGGIKDIQNHIIRAVGDPKERFYEDPLRMLRTIRFACRFGFDIEENTKKAIIELQKELKATYIDKEEKVRQRVSSERISKEIIGAINANPSKFLELYDATGLLEIVLPEVSNLHGVEQPPEFHSEGDVFEHTKLILQDLPKDASLQLRLAALFHDIGKRDTFQSPKGPGDRIRFNGHDTRSAELTDDILTKYCFKNDLKEEIVWLVRNHMKVLQSFSQMKLNKQEEMILHRGFDDLVKLSMADARSSLRPDGKVEIDQSIYETIDRVKRILSEQGNKIKKIIDGNEIISLIRQIVSEYDERKFGRLIGRIKEKINTDYANEEIKNKEEALAKAKELIDQELKKPQS